MHAGPVPLGPAVEFTPIAIRRAKRVVAIVNPQLPAMPGAEAIALDRIDLMTESDEPLRAYDAGGQNDESTRIATVIAAFVEDGATLQVGLGKRTERTLLPAARPARPEAAFRHAIGRGHGAIRIRRTRAGICADLLRLGRDTHPTIGFGTAPA